MNKNDETKKGSKLAFEGKNLGLEIRYLKQKNGLLRIYVNVEGYKFYSCQTGPHSTSISFDQE
jgi:hypothetical protein